MVCKNFLRNYKATRAEVRLLGNLLAGMLGLLTSVSLFSAAAKGQQTSADWQAEVRKYTEAQEWAAAMRIVERQIASAPQDMDVRAWHARILTWSGQLGQAEKEYREILTAAPNDPDTWMGLASVYSREGRKEEALRALDRAVELDPKRADLRAAHGRALLATENRSEAKLEFQRALDLDPTSAEARSGLSSVRGEPKHELRFGMNTDLFNFTSANHDGGASLISRWAPHWKTSLAGGFYERGGTEAGKFLGTLTATWPKFGTLTFGGAAAHDNGVIPKSEALFNYDRGWRLSESGPVRGMEFVYEQHWYWYTTARILTLNGTTIFYLPHDWTWSIGATGARSHFSGTGVEWRPSGITRLGFPIASGADRQLRGSIFFAAGTENFSQVDQIGRFSSQTYGGELRFRMTARQDVTGFAAHQRRTQDRTETSFGFTYGIHF